VLRLLDFAAETNPVTYRILFPALALLAVGVFLASAVGAAFLSLAMPVLFLALGAAAAATFRIGLAVRLIEAGFRTVGLSLRYLGGVVRCVFHPLQDFPEPELSDDPFPELFVRLQPTNLVPLNQLQQELAATSHCRAVDEFWISPEASLGIAEFPKNGKRVRALVLGVGFCDLLSFDEFRAALAHEFGHARGGHLRLGRWLRHCIGVLLDAQMRFSAWNPARWGSWFALQVMEAIYFPWSRHREYEADRFSAKIAGANQAIACLRKQRDARPAYNFALRHLLGLAANRRVAPVKLGASARELSRSLPPGIRKTLSVQDEGNPLDLGGRTHPPTALRIAALTGLPEEPGVDPRPAWNVLGLDALDDRLTRRWLTEFGIQKWLTEDQIHLALSEEGGAGDDSPVPHPSAESAMPRLSDAGDELELDTRDASERTWGESTALLPGEPMLDLQDDSDPLPAGRKSQGN
jgi:Zn-dependent protease with chaperone function